MGLPPATAIAGGRSVPTDEITGVLTRWPRFLEQELTGINQADRAFVAAEMTAFMTAWLAQLPCPVLNRPTSLSLCGPPWRREEWVHRACALRIPVVPARRTAAFTSPRGASPTEAPQPPTNVTVVAKFHSRPPLWGHSLHSPRSVDSLESYHSFGDADPQLHRHARNLAAATGLGLLQVSFDGSGSEGRFTGASLWPPVHEPPISTSLHQYFQAAELGRRHAPV